MNLFKNVKFLGSFFAAFFIRRQEVMKVLVVHASARVMFHSILEIRYNSIFSFVFLYYCIYYASHSKLLVINVSFMSLVFFHLV